MHPTMTGPTKYTKIVHTEDSFLLKLYYKLNFATEPFYGYIFSFFVRKMVRELRGNFPSYKQAKRASVKKCVSILYTLALLDQNKE